ncbi:hypothetical protein PINS_up000978 [Pythium insidiosum]|nr:hypothetical protein PINS_up000978 [Pythium insidiosum]
MLVIVAWLSLLTLAVLGVGVLGLARIAKDRPSLAAHERPPEPSAEELHLRLAKARDARLSTSKLGAETVPATEQLVRQLTAALRAREEREARDEAALLGVSSTDDLPWVARVVVRAWALAYQLAGIPLLTGDSGDASTAAIMGNCVKQTAAAPTTTTTTEEKADRRVLDGPIENNADVKAETKTVAEKLTQQEESHDADVEDESDEEDMEDTASSVDTEEAPEDARRQTCKSPLPEGLLDGLEFYIAVNSVAVTTVRTAIEIAVAQATSVLLRDRRNTMTRASIHAIEELYPDITCLPSGSVSKPKPKSLVKKSLPDPLDATSPADEQEPPELVRRRSSLTSPRASNQAAESLLSAA